MQNKKNKSKANGKEREIAKKRIGKAKGNRQNKRKLKQKRESKQKVTGKKGSKGKVNGK